jgi:hypothetical protein
VHGEYITGAGGQLMSEEDTFLWLSRVDLKSETKSEIIAAQDRLLQTKYLATKYYKRKQIAKADYVNNLMRQ